MNKRIYTAESVTSGHPDKLADLIADSILDECLEQDADSRVAVEVMLTHDKCFIGGEITTKARVDYEFIARATIAQVGYDPRGLDYDIHIHEQSMDIAGAVDRTEQGAGDQGIVYGYATTETLNFMPLPVELAHRLTDRLEQCRRRGIIKGLCPDGKSQVTVEYDGRTPVRVAAIVLSAQHEPDISMEKIRGDLTEAVIREVVPGCMIDADTRIYINPTGRFVLGGSASDTGLTGRKIIADTYGGYARHGGGAFSGKDPTKVDRSAALMLRHIAKTIVASHAADECELQAAYAIGVSEPISLSVNTFGTSRICEESIAGWILDNFNLSPAGMISYLGLCRPIYYSTAGNGPFGWNDRGYTWEKVNAEALEKLNNLCRK